MSGSKICGRGLISDVLPPESSAMKVTSKRVRLLGSDALHWPEAFAVTFVWKTPPPPGTDGLPTALKMKTAQLPQAIPCTRLPLNAVTVGYASQLFGPGNPCEALSVAPS